LILKLTVDDLSGRSEKNHLTNHPE